MQEISYRTIERTNSKEKAKAPKKEVVDLEEAGESVKQKKPAVYVDLISDDEDDAQTIPDDDLQFLRQMNLPQREAKAENGDPMDVDQIMDLVNDINAKDVTEQDCILRVLDVLPDIDTDWISAQYAENYDEYRAQIVDFIVQKAFEGTPPPQQPKRTSSKRSRENESDVAEDELLESKRVRYETDKRDEVTKVYLKEA